MSGRGSQFTSPEGRGLAGRDVAALEPDAADLRARYNVEVGLHTFDVVEASAVGDATLRAVENKTDIVYVSAKWRLVMLIIKTLPEAVFKKLKF